MDRKKLKLLVLLLLVAVNLFLCANIVISYHSALSAEKEMLKNALLVINRPDFDEEMFFSLPRYRYSYRLSGGQNAERALSARLLGEYTESAESDGNAVFSNGDRYIAFGRGGETGGLIRYDFIDTAEYISREFSADRITCSPENGFVSCCFDGLPIFNAGLSVSSTDGRVSFSGTFPVFDGVNRTERTLSRAELALALYSNIDGTDFGKLLSLSTVYTMRSDAQGKALLPCLRADCEGGTLIIGMNDKSLVYSGD